MLPREGSRRQEQFLHPLFMDHPGSLVGHLGCDRRGDQSGGDKEHSLATTGADNERRRATAPPDTFSDQVVVPLPMS